MIRREHTLPLLLGHFSIYLLFGYLLYYLVGIYYYQGLLALSGVWMGSFFDLSLLSVSDSKLHLLADRLMVRGDETVRIGIAFGREDVIKLHGVLGTTPFFIALLLLLSVSWKRLSFMLGVMVFFHLSALSLTLTDMTFHIAGNDPLMQAYLLTAGMESWIVEAVDFFQLYTFVYLPKVLPFLMGSYLWEAESHILMKSASRQRLKLLIA